LVSIYKEFDGKALNQEATISFNSKIERLLSHDGALYVQVTGSLYKIPLPVRTIEPPTRDEKQNKFSVLRIERSEYLTGDNSSTFDVFTFISESKYFAQRKILAVVSDKAII
jgi:hypothetical protein